MNFLKESKYALNSTIGTETFDPLDNIVERQEDLVSSCLTPTSPTVPQNWGMISERIASDRSSDFTYSFIPRRNGGITLSVTVRASDYGNILVSIKVNGIQFSLDSVTTYNATTKLIHIPLNKGERVDIEATINSPQVPTFDMSLLGHKVSHNALVEVFE